MKRTAVILATGPSLTPEVIETARKGQELGLWSVFGMNEVWKVFPTLDHLHCCNFQYYDVEWNRGLKDLPCSKTTIDLPASRRYGIRYIAGKWAEGFSRDPQYIHYGHSSGFQTPQLAVHDGFTRLLLCGYDMTFAPNYDGKNKRIGSSPRHFFGEYEHPTLNHWPSVKVKDGVFTELVDLFGTVKKLNPDIEIINCSPGSAMKCFPFANLSDFIRDEPNEAPKKRGRPKKVVENE